MEYIKDFDQATGTVKLLDVSAPRIILTDYNSSPIFTIAQNACRDARVEYLDLSGTSLKVIELYAFFHCPSLVTVLFPESLESIGGNAFYGAKIDDIRIPKNVNSLNGYFINQNLGTTIFDVASDNQYFCSENGFLFNKDKSVLVRSIKNILSSDEIPNIRTLTTIGPFCFTSTNIKTFIGYENIKFIQTHAFHAMGDIGIIDLSRTIVKVITDHCFWGCSASIITLPISLQSIAKTGFWNSNIKTLVLNKNVETIEVDSFLDCSKLTKIFYFGTSTQLKDILMFSGSTDLTRLKIFVTEDYTVSELGTIAVQRNWYFKARITCPVKNLHSFFTLTMSILVMQMFLSQ